MRKISRILSIVIVVAAMAVAAQAQQIHGEYIESRNADVYTGHCFAMSEVNLVGDQAILAWRVSKGEWNGVNLEGLSVVAVAKASGTLGNPYDNPLPARAVLIVDERATPAQREALKAFAREMAGDLLDDVVRTEAAPISMEVGYDGEHPSSGRVEAGTLAQIITRSLTSKDHICGNEQTYYPPLASTNHSMPAVAVVDQFKGKGLNVEWTNREKRSAFVGHFAK
ncbi:MAG: DUF1326 domain-containing protein [Acidobacteriota bacterium]|nr:MAG: DUF1326 domain-containing protein [Acidobacteriota bacterium]